MPEKYHIHTEPAPPRFRPVGKFGIVDWREDCSSCHNCVKRACVYGLYRDEADARRAIAWLAAEGYERIGILGTSLGSCLAMLTSAHEPLIRTQALNHISRYFADVVWEGLSTSHVRQSLDGNITLDRLRELWMPISPQAYVHRVAGKKTLLVYARYDTTFPVHLSLDLVREFDRLQVPYELFVLPCGHYTTGRFPFKLMDGLAMCRFLDHNM